MRLSQGVPQGSVFEPLLFNFYLTYLFFLSEFTDVCKFENDRTFNARDIDLN